MFKFNNGRGAIICDKCSVIIQEDVDYRYVGYNPHSLDVCESCRQKDNHRRDDSIKIEEIRNEIIQRN